MSLVAPVVTAATVSGAMSYVVARMAARSTIAGADIGAAVEREKLHHTREAWLASRRDQASRDLIELAEQMEIVANGNVLLAARQRAAKRARSALTAIVITLHDDSIDAPRVTELVEALRRGELVRATRVWSRISSKLMAGKLA
jgi:hypothetical protein